MKNIWYEMKKDFLYIKGKINKNWVDFYFFFEKFVIKYLWKLGWFEYIFFLIIVERGFKVVYFLLFCNIIKSNREIFILLDYSIMLYRIIIYKVGGI